MGNNLFINFSNHPSEKWPSEQLEAAKKYGEVIDLPFPTVNETATEEMIAELADTCLKKIYEVSDGHLCVVHIMGEMTLTFLMVTQLKAAGYTCVASTTARNVEILPDGTKQVRFQFCKFRKY